MAVNVPTLQPRDPELARIQQNLTAAIQTLSGQTGSTLQNGTLTLSPQISQVRGPGSPYTVATPALTINGRQDGPFQYNQPTTVFGNPRITDKNGVTTAQRDNSLFNYGQIVAFGSAVTPDGFVLVPQASGSAFRIAPNNAFNCFWVNTDGTAGCSSSFQVGTTLTAASVTSAAGFKQTVPMGTYSTSNSNNQTVSTQILTYDLSAAKIAPINRNYTTARAGSITAFTLVMNNGSFASGLYGIYKNNALLVSVAHTAGSATAVANFPKGTYPFVAGDILRIAASYNSGASVITTVDLEIETGA